MAVYEFECRSCGEQFEVTFSIKEHDRLKETPPACPKCLARSDFLSPFFHAHESDVHNPDRAHKKGKTGDEKPGDGDRVFDGVKGAF